MHHTQQAENEAREREESRRRDVQLAVEAAEQKELNRQYYQAAGVLRPILGPNLLAYLRRALEPRRRLQLKAIVRTRGFGRN